MKRAFHFALACLFLITGTSVLGQTGEARVLVIGIDGTRPDCLEAAMTPALDALIAELQQLRGELKYAHEFELVIGPSDNDDAQES